MRQVLTSQACNRLVGNCTWGANQPDTAAQTKHASCCCELSICIFCAASAKVLSSVLLPGRVMSSTMCIVATVTLH